MLRKQFRINEEDDGTTTVQYLEFDEKGTLVCNEIAPFELEEGSDLRAWFEDHRTDTSQEKAFGQPGSFDYDPSLTAEEIALRQSTGQTSADLIASNLMPISTSGRGATRVMGKDGWSQPGGPIKSGDPNVSDAARKREDGAAEPKLEVVDLNQPAQPIKGAPRGGAVLQSQLGGAREDLENAPVSTPGEKAIEAGATPEEAGYPKDEVRKASDSAELPDYGQNKEEKDKSAEEGEKGNSSVEVKSQTDKGSSSPKGVNK
jgi:hypothetical protein